MHGNIDNVSHESDLIAEELKRTIPEHPHFAGYTGGLPGESYLVVARRVLKDDAELAALRKAAGY
jgi:Xaa-Pro aminopeptidase